MSVRLRSMAVSAIAAATLVRPFLTPFAFAGTGVIRWVDDDAGAGGGPAACATAGYTAIQAAINDSASGDRVFVCPGTYTEQLVLDRRVLVEAKPLHRAILQPPSVPPLGTQALIAIPADEARLRGFTIQFAAGDAGDQCQKIQIAIYASGHNDVVRNNNMATTGHATLTGDCGYQAGIDISGTGDVVKFNHVTDFQVAGIFALGPTPKVVRNTVRFLHVNESSSACIAFSACQPFGIFASTGYIARNTVYSGSNACLSTSSCSTGATPATMGIYVTAGGNPAPGAIVDDNAIYRTMAGVFANGAPSTMWIGDNELTHDNTGILVLDGSGGEITGNLVQRNQIGMMLSGSGRNIHDNDVRGNTQLDCYDATTGSGTAGTANTWTNNLGGTSLPEGICVSPPAL